MSDLKPPKSAVDERHTLLALLQFQRESVVRKVAGIDEEAARKRLVGSDTTLLWLLKHLARAESLWVEHRFAAKDDYVSHDTITPDDTVASAVAAYQQTWEHVDAIVAAASLEDLCLRPDTDEAVNLRWVLMHLLEETARHAGHADIIREQLDGQTGR